jgi:hypothetical protein
VAANAIYFPYINVPPDPWLLRMLLYWDRLSAIVPLDYHEEPLLLERKMRDLVTAGLVNPIAPGFYLGNINRFADPFLRFAEHWCCARLNGREWPQTLIHAEKLDSLTEPLVEMGVLRRAEGPWFQMPSPLADRFMAYLATALGRIPEIDAAPVTNNSTVGRSLRGTGLEAKRDALLEVMFPMPHGSEMLTLDDIVEFKAKYQRLAERFRTRLERECILIADGITNDERQERLHALAGKLQDEVDEITEAMRGQWKKVVLAKVAPVLAPMLPLLDADWAKQQATFAGAVAVSGLALFQARLLQATDDEIRGRPLAYVAVARRQLLALRPRS